jgi:predicted small secreted protein
MIKKILLTIILIVMAFLIIGCQTVEGVGEDIKWTGEKTAEMLEGK